MEAVHNNAVKPVLDELKPIALATLILALDFLNSAVYGIFAGYFARLFFPPGTAHALSLTVAYVISILRSVSRIGGGNLFTYLGQRMGINQLLIISAFFTALIQFSIALLPTYAEVGVTALYLMIMLMFLQGIAIGNKIPQIASYIFVSFPQRSPLYLGILFAGFSLSALFVNGLNSLLVHCFTHKEMVEFGWRIAFVVGGVFSIFTIKLREYLYQRQEMLTARHTKHQPFRYLLRYFKLQVLIGFVLVGFLGVLASITQIYMFTYLSQVLNYLPHEVAVFLAVGNVCDIIASITIGYLTYKYFNRCHPTFTLYLTCFLLIIAYYPAYVMLINKTGLFFGIAIINLLKGFVNGILIFSVLHLFPTNLRYSATSFVLNFGMLLFYGLCPAANTILIHYTKNVFVPAYLSIIYAALVIIVIIITHPRFKYGLSVAKFE